MTRCENGTSSEDLPPRWPNLPSAAESCGASLAVLLLNLSLFFRMGIVVTCLTSCSESSFDSEMFSEPSYSPIE